MSRKGAVGGKVLTARQGDGRFEDGGGTGVSRLRTVSDCLQRRRSGQKNLGRRCG